MVHDFHFLTIYAISEGISHISLYVCGCIIGVFVWHFLQWYTFFNIRVYILVIVQTCWLRYSNPTSACFQKTHHDFYWRGIPRISPFVINCSTSCVNRLTFGLFCFNASSVKYSKFEWKRRYHTEFCAAVKPNSSSQAWRCVCCWRGPTVSDWTRYKLKTVPYQHHEGVVYDCAFKFLCCACFAFYQFIFPMTHSRFFQTPYIYLLSSVYRVNVSDVMGICLLFLQFVHKDRNEFTAASDDQTRAMPSIRPTLLTVPISTVSNPPTDINVSQDMSISSVPIASPPKATSSLANSAVVAKVKLPTPLRQEIQGRRLSLQLVVNVSNIYL